MPWLVRDVAFPPACWPLSAWTAELRCHRWGRHHSWRAARSFVSLRLPVVFVYQGITGVTLQSGTTVCLLGRMGTAPLSTRNWGTERQQQAAGPSFISQAGMSGPHWYSSHSFWLALPVRLTPSLPKPCQNGDKIRLHRQRTEEWA